MTNVFESFVVYRSQSCDITLFYMQASRRNFNQMQKVIRSVKILGLIPNPRIHKHTDETHAHTRGGGWVGWNLSIVWIFLFCDVLNSF